MASRLKEHFSGPVAVDEYPVTDQRIRIRRIFKDLSETYFTFRQLLFTSLYFIQQSIKRTREQPQFITATGIKTLLTV